MYTHSKIWTFRTLLIVLATIAVIGCKKENSETGTLKIGVLLGFSGTGSQNAAETRAALDVCLEDIQGYIQRNGLNVKVELVFEDTKSDTAEAKLKAQGLIDQGIRLIIGPYTSAEARAVKQLADAQHVLLVSHSAVSASLAIPGDNFMRFVPCDTYQAEAVNAMFASDSVLAILPIVRNDLWSNSLYAATIAGFISQGGNALTRQTFEPGSSDFQVLSSNVKAAYEEASVLYGANHVAVYLISYADGTSVLEGLQDAGFPSSGNIMGASAFAQSATLPASSKAAGLAVSTQLQCPVFGFDEGASSVYLPIQDRAFVLTGSKIGIYALSAYDILRTAFQAFITQQDNPDFEEYKTHFMETAALYFGATGRTELDANGDRKHVYYDFWSIEQEGSSFVWRIAAKYNTTNKSLVKSPRL